MDLNRESHFIVISGLLKNLIDDLNGGVISDDASFYLQGMWRRLPGLGR